MFDVILHLDAGRVGCQFRAVGGANPGGGSGPASISEAALADLGPGSDEHSVANTRQVGQATGVAGKEFPDEFKSGLDSYFSLLEKQAAAK